jgi:hypothetical protein
LFNDFFDLSEYLIFVFIKTYFQKYKNWKGSVQIIG